MSKCMVAFIDWYHESMDGKKAKVKVRAFCNLHETTNQKIGPKFLFEIKKLVILTLHRAHFKWCCETNSNCVKCYTFNLILSVVWRWHSFCVVEEKLGSALIWPLNISLIKSNLTNTLPQGVLRIMTQTTSF